MKSADQMPAKLGPYRLLDRIGEGGMGVVYLARDAEQRSVALKVLRPAVAGDPNARRRLAREVEMMRRVHSPFVAEVFDTDVTGDTPYIATRYVPGRTLDEVVGEQGPLRGPALGRLAHGLAQALTAVHAAGVVHRDLKPGNVMLLNGDPVVIDFGIAQALDSTRLTMTGMFMGTPGYLSPEVIEGGNSTDASDVHAWAATVAYAATGRPPFGTGSYETVFYRIVNGRPDLGGIAPPLAALLAAALHRDPAQRPPSVHLALQIAALDPAALEPVPVQAAYGALAPGAYAPGTRAEGPWAGAGAAAGMAGPGPAGAALAGLAGGSAATRSPGSVTPGPVLPGAAVPAVYQPGTSPFPNGRIRASDYADVLPPVSYAPPAGRGGLPAGQDPAGNGQPYPGAAPRQADEQRTRRSYPLIVFAAMVMLVGIAVILPVVGTLIALSVLVLLKAGDRAARGGDAAGSTTSAVITAVAFPWYLARSVLSTLLLAPFALSTALIAAIVTLVAVPVDGLARAVAFGAGALVAFYALGPGSRKPRRQLNRLLRGVIRSQGAEFVVLLGFAVLAFGAAATALSSPSAFWPLMTPSGLLPHFHPGWSGVMRLLHGHFRRVHF
jgi:predicted Ser/Thr protein kinase